MTVSEVMEIWDYQHPENKFWEDCRQYVPAPIDFDALVNFLVYQHADSYTVYSQSTVMHDHIVNFFKIHNWNLTKLAASLEFQYDPIQDVRYWVDSDQTHNETDLDSRERTQHEGDTRNLETGEEEYTQYTRDEKTTDDKTKDTTQNETRTESKQQDTTGETVHFVSAYNDVESRENNLTDTEEWRETNPGSSSTENNTITTDTTTNETTHEEGTLDRGDSTGRTLGTTEDETKAHTETEGENKKRTEEEVNKRTDFTHGTRGNTFQSLTEQERKQAEFNIYKWIDKHFSRECVLPIW